MAGRSSCLARRRRSSSTACPMGRRCATSASTGSRTWRGRSAYTSSSIRTCRPRSSRSPRSIERRGSLPAEPSAFVGREEERAAMVDAPDRPTGPARDAHRSGRHRQDAARASASRGTSTTASRRGRPSSTFPRRATRRRCSRRSRATSATATSASARRSDELAERIGTQQLLVVLDNFEQVTVSAPALSQLLRECPELKLLVTSREALHVQGEHIFPVEPMSVPDARETVTSARAGRAVRGRAAVRGAGARGAARLPRHRRQRRGRRRDLPSPRGPAARDRAGHCAPAGLLARRAARPPREPAARARQRGA